MADDNTKSIRRIMKGVKEDPTGLGLADDYKGIGTSRGEAFINSRGDVTGSGSNGSGDDKNEQPPSSTPSTGNPDDNDTGGGGGVNDGSDPTGALSGDVDAVVPLIDTGTQVGTVTGTDPITTDPVSFNPNTLEGIEYNPPPNWDDPDSPPDHLENDSTAYAKCAVFFGGSASSYENGGTWTTDGGIVRCYIGGVFQGLGGHNVPSTTCSAIGGISDLGGFCDLDDPSLTPHPSDGSCDVVYDQEAGGYKGHEKDPDCSAAQKIASPSIIIRSVDDPNKFYKFTRLSDGGLKITEVDSGGVIIPDSVIKTIDEGGRFSNVYPDTLDASII